MALFFKLKAKTEALERVKKDIQIDQLRKV